MRFFSFLASILMVLGFSTTSQSADGPLISFEGSGSTVVLTADDLSSGKDASLEAAMPDPVLFVLRRDSPSGISLAAVYGDSGENLLATVPPDMQGFDENGELEEDFSIQLGVSDLNADGVPEVLVATGDGVAILSVAIFVYNPQGEERFRCTGVVDGQISVRVEADGTIVAPFGSQGLFTAYTVAADGSVAEKE